jgi:hydrogenase expression/formation protein HypE
MAFVPESEAGEALAILQRHHSQAAIIGSVQAGHRARVVATNQLGTARIVDMLTGEQLPRIC